MEERKRERKKERGGQRASTFIGIQASKPIPGCLRKHTLMSSARIQVPFSDIHMRSLFRRHPFRSQIARIVAGFPHGCRFELPCVEATTNHLISSFDLSREGSRLIVQSYRRPFDSSSLLFFLTSSSSAEPTPQASPSEEAERSLRVFRRVHAWRLRNHCPPSSLAFQISALSSPWSFCRFLKSCL